MKCLYCNHEDTKVMETRESVESTRRRRECLSCEKRFTTYEKPEIIEITVLKKNNVREAFDRDKLKKGMSLSCEKRPVTEEQIDNAVDQIERRLRRRKNKEVTSKDLGNMVLTQLRKLDQVAYIRFASVYREFSDLTSFQVELKKIIKTK